MLLNGSENDKLFAKRVPICMKDVYTNQSRTTHLFLTMEWQEPSAGMYNKKVLSIALTDDDDPFFLYNMHLSEEDFQKLKVSQDLLIQFSAFPHFIIDYTEKCLKEEKDPQSRFLLVFTRNPTNVAASSRFDIIETNEFKNLTHLFLDFFAATDSAVRQYINSSIRRLKEERRQLQNNLSFCQQDLGNRLADTQQAYNAKAEETESVKKECSKKLEEVEQRYQGELKDLKEEFVRKHDEEIERLKQKSEAKESNSKREKEHLLSELNIANTDKKELQDKILKLESAIEKLKSKVDTLEGESKRLKENLQTYTHECDELQSVIQQKDGVILDLQREIKSKEQTNLMLKTQIESEIEHKRVVDKQFENVRFNLEMSEKQRQTLEKETEKLNRVIINLQKNLEEACKQEKTKSQTAGKYKKAFEEKEKALLDIQHEFGELKISLKAKDVEIKSLVDSNYILEKKLEDTRKQLKDTENVNRWLNKQLTDNCIVPQYVPLPHLITSPSAVAQKQLAKISSQSPENPPHVIMGKNPAGKSVRIETTSPVYRRNSSSPSHFHKTPGTDSAYCTASLHSNQTTSEVLAGNHMNFDPENFDVDQEAVSAAFGNGGHVLKHSTAKKPTKPVKSSIPKTSKKR